MSPDGESILGFSLRSRQGKTLDVDENGELCIPELDCDIPEVPTQPWNDPYEHLEPEPSPTEDAWGVGLAEPQTPSTPEPAPMPPAPPTPTAPTVNPAPAPEADGAALSVAVAQTLFSEGAPAIGVATTSDFADALTGGAHVALAQGPLLLSPETIPAAMVDWVRAADRQVYVYGGEQRFSEEQLQRFTEPVKTP